jgi:flotillin
MNISSLTPLLGNLEGISPGLLGIPLAAILLVIAILAIIRIMASRYVKVGPDEIAVFSGRKYKVHSAGGVQERGFYILQGGGKILLPIVEKVQIIKTSAFQVPVAESNVPNKDNVSVNVKGVSTCRLSLAEEDLANTVSNFLTKQPEERTEFIENILKGHLRSIVGNLTIDQLLRERQQLNERVVQESSPELKRLGVELITLTIQDVRDEHGYIDALGKQQIAQTMRDAAVSVAEAERDQAIKTSDAKRAAAEVAAKNETLIAQAQKEKDLQVAGFKQETESKRAHAETAFAIAMATQDKQRLVAEADRDQAAREAQARVQEMEGTRRKQELQATLVTDAEAQKQVAALKAETIRLEAEGVKNAAIETGKGEAQKAQIVAEGQAAATLKTKTAEADGRKAVLLAEAEGKKASLLADADGTKASRLAEAEGKRQSLLAEAEGTQKLADALRQMSEQGQLIIVLDRLPKLLEVGGTAGAQIAEAVFGNVARGVEKIGTVTITDLGGGHTAAGGISALGAIVPKIVADFFANAKARGIDVTEVLKRLGIEPSVLTKLIGPVTGGAAAPASTSTDGNGKVAEIIAEPVPLTEHRPPQI